MIEQVITSLGSDDDKYIFIRNSYLLYIHLLVFFYCFFYYNGTLGQRQISSLQC